MNKEFAYLNPLQAPPDSDDEEDQDVGVDGESSQVEQESETENEYDTYRLDNPFSDDENQLPQVPNDVFDIKRSLFGKYKNAVNDKPKPYHTPKVPSGMHTSKSQIQGSA